MNTVDKARGLFLAGRFEEALAALDAALTTATQRPELWNNRGTILAALNLPEDACDAFSRAVILNPEFAGAIGNRANALLGLGRYEEAARDYERVLSASGAMPYARGNLLHCRLRVCDWRNFDME